MKKKSKNQLLFIYNANSGVRNAFMDSIHKTFSPKTYDCNLCDITFGLVSENKTWKRFREEKNHEMTFLHKGGFAKKYKSKFGYKFTFPTVLVEGEKGLEVLISTDEINQLKTSEELVRLVNERAK
jgi:hypothetical protein